MKILFLLSVLVILSVFSVNAAQQPNRPANSRAAAAQAQKRRPQADAPLPGSLRRPGGGFSSLIDDFP